MNAFEIDLSLLQPSQLYVCQEELDAMLRVVERIGGIAEPIPVKRRACGLVMTDGHSRALAAYRCVIHSVLAVWEREDLDWEAYDTCVAWCREEGIRSIDGLEERVVPAEQFGIVWLERCRILHDALARKRSL